jgi:excisionase family DNA binding protein
MPKIPPDQVSKFPARRRDPQRDPEPANIGEGAQARPRGPPAQVAQLPPFLPIKKACEVAGLGRSKLYEIVGDGLVRAVKIGSKTLIDTNSLLAYLENLPAAKINPQRLAIRKRGAQTSVP